MQRIAWSNPCYAVESFHPTRGVPSPPRVKDRMRMVIKSPFDPLTLTLSLRERGITGAALSMMWFVRMQKRFKLASTFKFA
jgi:hypothetical protein